MKNLLFTLVISAIAFPALAIDKEFVRVIPEKQFMTIEIDGQFPAGPEADILFVIDDSGSMSSHQSNLVKHIDILVNAAEKSGNDFHIGILNTYFGTNGSYPNVEGELLGQPKVITQKTPDFAEVLRQNLLLGQNGSGNESVFRPIMTALSPENTQGMNSGFLRKDAHLSVVVLTDAEEQSMVTPWDFADYLVDLKGGVENVSMQGIMITAEDVKNSTCKGEKEDGSPRILEAIRLLNGEAFSLCSGQMAQDIEILSKNIFPPFKGDFKPGIFVDNVVLVGVPIKDTIKVRFGTQVLKNDLFQGWDYDEQNNTLNFGSKIEWKPQPKNTRIVITYEVQ